VTLSHPSGLGLVAVPDRALAFREAGALLAELRQLADHDPLPHHGAAQHGVLQVALHESYRICEGMTREHSKSFYFSSQLLPPAKRRAVRALYAFCRTSDDLVDLPGTEGADLTRALACWVALVHSPHAPHHHPILPAWSDMVAQYSIPQALVDELLAGIAMDLTVHRYATFDELWVYCYRVASVVGLLSMQIIGHAEGATPYAVKLGVALQLTNILRDVGEDARRGRVYLPQEDLERFGLTDADILEGRRDDRFRDLMRFEIARAQQLYDEAWAGISLLSADSQLAIGAASEVYRAILANIEKNDYDVFTRRAHVSLVEKLRILWRVRARLRRERRDGAE
jgi:15-cis-phytoene synthase